MHWFSFRGKTIQPMEPTLQEYWEEMGIRIPNADPMDSPDTLLTKSAHILEHSLTY